jgi:glucose-1-phosphate thymidylyltransferase
MQNIIKKAIILAGGEASRLRPITSSTSKQLLHVYDKPMIYYSISLIMLMGIKEILIITSSNFLKNYKLLLNDGKEFGIKIHYKIQDMPRGIPEALKIGKKFLKKDSFILLLGDNIFYGHGLIDLIEQSISNNIGCSIFTYKVNNPENFGILKISKKGKILKIVEKPKKYISDLAITGLYIFDKKSHDYFKKIKPSKRGELEIVSILNLYLKNSGLKNCTLTRGISWFDTGTFDSLLNANNLIHTAQKSNNQYIGSIEEVAFNNRWINKQKLKKLIKSFNNEYGSYLKKVTL